MILQKRKEAAIAFSQGLPESSLRYRLAQKWHHFAVFAVLLLLAAAIGSAILGTASGQGILTLLMVPLYFLLDWILRLMLEAAFGMVEQPQEQPVTAAATSDGPEDDVEAEAAPSPAGEASEDKAAGGGRLDLDRMKGPLRTALRLALAVLLFFWILDIWNVDLPSRGGGGQDPYKDPDGRADLLRCLGPDQRRHHAPDAPGDAGGGMRKQEEGGAGGSRIATLLLLLRKFMLVVIIVMAALIVLSALGVNIGPLIAGAGVFGLAIGFGAQTLVKDIISGVFFLMDDAFRVGDYLECSGTKGSVEHISLRSLRLRNPRGQVYFIPFGDIARQGGDPAFEALEQPGDAGAAHPAAPAVDEGAVAAAAGMFQQLLGEPLEPRADPPQPDHHRLASSDLLVGRAHLGPFVVAEQRDVHRPGDVTEGELRRRAHVDHR